MRSRFRLPEREHLLNSRMLRPFRRWLHHHALWERDRDAIARGAAIGVFFGLLVPVAQILFAAVSAILLRANLPVAAAATLVTNPLTFPLVYWLAYQVGIAIVGVPAAVTGTPLAADEGSEDIGLSEEAASHALEVVSWFDTLFGWATSIGAPLAIGLGTLAVAGAVLTWMLVQGGWRLAQRLRPGAAVPRRIGETGR